MFHGKMHDNIIMRKDKKKICAAARSFWPEKIRRPSAFFRPKKSLKQPSGQNNLAAAKKVFFSSSWLICGCISPKNMPFKGTPPFLFPRFWDFQSDAKRLPIFYENENKNVNDALDCSDFSGGLKESNQYGSCSSFFQSFAKKEVQIFQTPWFSNLY